MDFYSDNLLILLEKTTMIPISFVQQFHDQYCP